LFYVVGIDLVFRMGILVGEMESLKESVKDSGKAWSVFEYMFNGVIS